MNKQVFMKQKVAQSRLYKSLPKLNNGSGIYVIKRIEEHKFAYIGQAKHLTDRLVSHLIGYQQRIDISLKKRGLAPKGEWIIQVYNCKENELDKKEREFIDTYLNDGWELYNITNGGQNEGKVDINQRQSGKNYHDGLKQGYQNCLKELREYFEKYLVADIKEPKLNKNGTQNALKVRKLNDFIGWLKK